MPVLIGQLRSAVIKLRSYEESTERSTERKTKKKTPGESNSPWTFFEALDSILGHKPATCPPTTIDSSRSSQPSDEELDRTEDDSVEVESSKTSTGEQTQGRDQSGTADSPASNTSSSSSTSRGKSPVTHPHTPSGPPSKKRKIAKSEQAIHAVQAVVDQLLTAQKESEDKFSRIEQKRLELDTQMLEMERERQHQDSLLLRQMMRVLSNNGDQGFVAHPMYQPYGNPDNYQ